MKIFSVDYQRAHRRRCSHRDSALPECDRPLPPLYSTRKRQRDVVLAVHRRHRAARQTHSYARSGQYGSAAATWWQSDERW